MRKMKKMAAVLFAMAMTASVSFPAMADTDYDYIYDVSVEISHDIEIDGNDSELYVSVLSQDCYVDDERTKISNLPDDAWEDGDKPKITIVLEVEDDEEYRFAKDIDEDDISIDGTDAKITDVSRSNSGRKLTIKVELPKLEREEGFYEEALQIEEIELDESTGIGYWLENEYAKRYEVRIFRNDSSVAGTLKTTRTDYDFSDYFTRRGDYYFKVRGVRNSDITGEWCDSDEIYVDSDEAREIRLYGGYDESYTSSTTTNNSSGSSSGNNTNASGPAGNSGQTPGEWLQNSIGWWWCNPDRTYPANNWKEIDGAWYYFNQNGYRVDNTWILSKDGKTWYYCGPNGVMVTNTWVLSSGIWYYCGPDGAMWTSRRTPDGYYVDSNGAWIQ